MITEREFQILRLLISNKRMRAEDLSTRLDVSSRTIMRDMSNLVFQLKDKGISIKSSNEGYEIAFASAVEERILYNLLKTHDSLEIYKKIFILILENEKLKTLDLSEILFESETSIINKIRQLNKMLEVYELEIISNKGFSIKGREENIRNYLLENFMIISDNVFYSSLLTSVADIDIDKLKTIIKNEMIISNQIITDRDFADLISLFIVCIYRNENKLDKGDIYHNPIVLRIVNKVNTVFGVSLDFSEASYIVKNSIFDKVDNKKLSISIQNVIKNSIERINNESINKYFFNPEFYDSFSKHLELLVKRNLKNTYIKNPLLTELKKKYLIEFSDANIIREELEKEFDINVTEDEIGYLAIHLGASEKRKTDTKKVIIICNYGIGTSQVVRLKIENDYKNLDVIGLYPVSYLDMAIAQKPDYIISTVKINQPTDKIPVVDASKILYSEERLIFEKKDNLLNKLLSENLFFDIEVRDKDDFFERAINLISEKINIQREILESVQSHEDYVSTEIGNLVAIPHGIEKGDFNSFVTIFRLNSQIFWNKMKVKFIFFILINEKEKFYIDSLKDLYAYILEGKNISKMSNAKDFEEFTKEII